MTTPADILREARKCHLDRAEAREAEAAELEQRAASCRERAGKLRQRASQIGGAIMALEGDEATLDLPEGVAPPSMLDAL